MFLVPEKRRRVQAGEKHNRWTVIGMPFYVKTPSQSRNTGWRSDPCCVCECECGKIAIVDCRNLIKGLSQSCGCYRTDNIKSGEQHHSFRHGYGRHRLLGIFGNMHYRCSNPSADRYQKYGGRGIGVCGDWSEFEAFRDWALENGYRDDLSLERNDVNGNYEPGNCCWIPVAKQSRNKQDTVYVEAFGERKDLIAWTEDPRCLVSYKGLYKRIRKGWHPEKAITTARMANQHRFKEE